MLAVSGIRPARAATDGQGKTLSFDYHATLSHRAYASSAWVYAAAVDNGPFNGQPFSLTLDCRPAVNGPQTRLLGDAWWIGRQNSLVTSLHAVLPQPGPDAVGYLEPLAPTSADLSGWYETPKDAWSLVGTMTLPENVLCTSSQPAPLFLPPAPVIDGHITVTLRDHWSVPRGQYPPVRVCPSGHC